MNLKAVSIALAVALFVLISTVLTMNRLNDGPIWLTKMRSRAEKHLHIKNPCNDMFKNQNFWIYDGDQRRKNTFLNIIIKTCNLEYNDDFRTVLEELSRCRGMSRRKKRSLVFDLLETTGSAVFNFFKSRYFTKETTRTDAIKSFDSNFRLNEIANEEAFDYVSHYSETSYRHPEQIRTQLIHLEPVFWAIGKIHGEMIAGQALVKALVAQCKLGQVATYELGELLNDPSIRELPPESTKLISIERTYSEQDGDSFQFLFAVNIIVSKSVLEIANIVIIALASLVAIFSLAYKTIMMVANLSGSRVEAETPANSPIVVPLFA